jgi:hypothetical protein
MTLPALPLGHGSVDAPRRLGRDFLEPPVVAVGVVEREPRAVGTAPGIRAADGAVRAEVVDLAHLDAGGDQFVPRDLDVRDDPLDVSGLC